MFPNGIQILKYQLSFQRSNGLKVATKKDQKSKKLEIRSGNNYVGKIVPTSILFEKSGDGNKSNPKNNPISIAIIASFSLKFFL